MRDEIALEVRGHSLYKGLFYFASKTVLEIAAALSFRVFSWSERSNFKMTCCSSGRGHEIAATSWNWSWSVFWNFSLLLASLQFHREKLKPDFVFEIEMIFSHCSLTNPIHCQRRKSPISQSEAWLVSPQNLKLKLKLKLEIWNFSLYFNFSHSRAPLNLKFGSDAWRPHVAKEVQRFI